MAGNAAGRKYRVLIITGIYAYESLKKLDLSALSERYEFHYYKYNKPIAAFITKKDLERILSDFPPDKFDFVLVSGLVSWDLKIVSGPYTGRIKKGPRYLSMLPEILKNHSITEFSTDVPADKLFTFKIKNEISVIIGNFKEKILSDSILRDEAIIIKNGANARDALIAHPRLPPLVLGEIVDAPKLSYKEIVNKVSDYLNKGVDIIDLGAISSTPHPEFFTRIIPELKEEFGGRLYLSVDSLDPDEIEAACNAGCDMVLSISPDNLEAVLEGGYLKKDTPVVAVPISLKGKGNQNGGNKTDGKNTLFILERELRSAGYTNIFLDPLLDSPIQPGFTGSLEKFWELRRLIDRSRNGKGSNDSGADTRLGRNTQIFMGVGNVVEMIDADSPGINAILGVIAAELGISAILSTEYSNKCRNSLGELRKGIDLAYTARIKKVPPLNLGIDAFSFKSKEPLPKIDPQFLVNARIINFKRKDYTNPPVDSGIFENSDNTPILLEVPTENVPAIMDPAGFFKIYLDYAGGWIYLAHFKNSPEPHPPDFILKGTDAESLYKAAISAKLVGRMDHCAYLGKELMKAELALKKGAGFVQD